MQGGCECVAGCVTVVTERTAAPAYGQISVCVPAHGYHNKPVLVSHSAADRSFFFLQPAIAT